MGAVMQRRQVVTQEASPCASLLGGRDDIDALATQEPHSSCAEKDSDAAHFFLPRDVRRLHSAMQHDYRAVPFMGVSSLDLGRWHSLAASFFVGAVRA
jgi:hypothetical protein